ncbi:hypothetical protein BLGI_4744 [Brevibacillus laterosporus GI-9]|uniref:hypothetical protein n=1 Tax=Brevibacillus laterosporus TaxID=1465 RepID=UPI0002405473|nr:hypothetical protein [Brevibacillus laterosporus]CCF16775.1 hypothetical protein BLGI_4744 [Brevibacillus laterosporus GI-9]
MNTGMQYSDDLEKQYIEEVVFLRLAIDVLYRDQKAIEAAPLRFRGPYLSIIENGIRNANARLSEARKGLWKAGIKIYQENVSKEGKGISIKYLCRGYDHRSDYISHVVKSKMESLIMDLLSSQ